LVDQATLLAHEPLVLQVASQYYHVSRYEMDDLIQQGWLGLLKAAKKWTPGRNVTFGAYARLWVKGSVYRYCFGRRPLWEDSAEPLMGEISGHPSERELLEADLLEDALGVLPESHAEVLRERILNRQSLTKTARCTGHTAGDALALYEQGVEMLQIFCE